MGIRKEKVQFELKPEHISLARRINFRTYVCTEEDGEPAEDQFRPEIDWKRPFGNSDFIYDVGKVLEEHGILQPCGDGQLPDDNYIRRCQQAIIELPAALRVIMEYQTFQPGIYEMEPYELYHYMRMKNFLVLNGALKEVKKQLSGHSEYQRIKTRLDMICMNTTDDDPWAVMDEIEDMEKYLTPKQRNCLAKAIGIFKTEKEKYQTL